MIQKLVSDETRISEKFKFFAVYEMICEAKKTQSEINPTTSISQSGQFTDKATQMGLCFLKVRPDQTVQTQIRLHLFAILSCFGGLSLHISGHTA